MFPPNGGSVGRFILSVYILTSCWCQSFNSFFTLLTPRFRLLTSLPSIILVIQIRKVSISLFHTNRFSQHKKADFDGCCSGLSKCKQWRRYTDELAASQMNITTCDKSRVRARGQHKVPIMHTYLNAKRGEVQIQPAWWRPDFTEVWRWRR